MKECACKLNYNEGISNTALLVEEELLSAELSPLSWLIMDAHGGDGRRCWLLMSYPFAPEFCEISLVGPNCSQLYTCKFPESCSCEISPLWNSFTLTLCTREWREAKNYFSNKSANKHGVRKTHYTCITFSMLYDHIERPLAIAIDSACLLLSENNQSIVYTHNIGLSLIRFLPHQNWPYLHIY